LKFTGEEREAKGRFCKDIKALEINPEFKEAKAYLDYLNRQESDVE
jgi:hypothetical protein